MSNYRNILVVVVVAIFYTNVPGYINMIATSTADSAPKFWAIGLGVLSFPLVIAQLLRSNILKSPLIVWCFGYAWVAVAWFFLSSQSDIAWEEVRQRVLSIFELLMFLVLFTHPNATKLARQALVVGVLFGVALNIYEFFVPMSFSHILGRSAGLYLNPNLSGEALVMGMVCSVSVLPSRFRGLFILFTGIGIFATLSRGGILAWMITVMGLMFRGGVRLKDFLLPVSAGLLLLVVVLLPRFDELYATFEITGASNKNVEERLSWFTDPTGVSDYSSWERAYLAKQAWEKIADHPLIGSGTGSAREDALFGGSHNQFLALMRDHGLLGAAILPLLVLAVTWGASRETRLLVMVFGSATIVLSLFTHTLLHQSYSLMLFALMAAMASSSREGESKKMQVEMAGRVGAPKDLVGI